MARPGPKTEPYLDGLRPRTVTFDDRTEEMARVLGNGNVSLGLREAVRFTYAAYQADKFTPPSKRFAGPAVPRVPGAAAPAPAPAAPDAVGSPPGEPAP